MFENDGELPYKKASRRKPAKKSDHKHDYETRILEPDALRWQTKVEVCKICGKEGNTFFDW